MTDPIVDAVCAKLQSRSAVGVKKYGTTLAGNATTVKEKLVHIQEELMDASNYVEWLLQDLSYGTGAAIAATRMVADENNRRRKELQEKEMAQDKLGCAADDNDLCFPCKVMGWVCEKAKERVKEMPTPMTIETEADWTNLKVEYLDQRQAALSDFEIGVRKVLWSRGSYEKFDINDFFDEDTIKTIRAALQSPRVPDTMFKKLGSLIKAADGGTFENDPHDAIVDAAIRILSAPRVPVIDGLDSIIQEGRTWYGVAGKIDPVAVPMKDFDVLMRCARAYAELQKGV